MKRDMLITSFTTWLPHQVSNASDDLLLRFLANADATCPTLRHLPVDHVLAPLQVIDAVDRLRPRLIVCCGMAEERERLNVESQAVMDGNVQKTDIDLGKLTADLRMTEISNDAGDFVCNTLYFRCLEHLRNLQGEHHCLFVHVPLLTPENEKALTEDFTEIIKRLAAL